MYIGEIAPEVVFLRSMESVLQISGFLPFPRFDQSQQLFPDSLGRLLVRSSKDQPQRLYKSQRLSDQDDSHVQDNTEANLSCSVLLSRS